MIAILPAMLLALQTTPDPPPDLASPAIVVTAVQGCGPPFARVYISPMGQPFRSHGLIDPEAAWFAQADADHDGKISFAEFSADAGRFFATLDIDRDGEIDPQEIIAYERDVAPEIHLFKLEDAERRPRTGAERKAARRAARKRVDYEAPYGAGEFSSLNIPEPVASADLDINRGVSRTEFATVAGQRFQVLDATHTGYLTFDMLPRSPAQQDIDACLAAAAKTKRR